MCCEKLFLMFLYLLGLHYHPCIATRHGSCLHEPSNRDIDTSKQFFSIGFGNIFIKQIIPKPDNGHTIVVPYIKEGGIYTELNLRGRKWGFTTGIRGSFGGYFEKFQESKDTHRMLGIRYSYSLLSYPLILNYKIINASNWKVFARIGLFLSRYSSETENIYNYPPFNNYAAKNRTSIDWGWAIIGSVGVDAEKNLYKKDIYLCTQLCYDGLPFKTLFNHLSINLGFNIMLSNIFYKERINARIGGQW
jgi:hypothetical protein